MNKWISLLLLLCLLLAGCGAGKAGTSAYAEDPLLTATIDYEDLFPEESLNGVLEGEEMDDELLLQEETMQQITVAISDKVFMAPTVADGFETLSDCEKVVFAVDYFDMEIQNGGLCQFFVNSANVVAPYLTTALEAVGAEQHQMLFDTFVKDNAIDVNDLSSFHITSIYEYQEQYERYPFDDFDGEYIALPPLADYLWTYIETNLDQLL